MSMLDEPGVVLGVASLVLGEGMEQRHAELVVRAGVDAGAAALDTARAYASVEDDAVGEGLAVVAEERRPGIPVITKAGHYRLGTASWDADGSAARLRRDAERSVEVLGGPPSLLLLLHRADQVDDVAASVRALDQLRRDGLAPRIGVSNASVEMLEQLEEVAEIDAVQNRLGLGVDSFAEYRYCRARGIDFFAYAPFGGPRAAPLATRVPRVAALAAERELSVHRLALAAMLDALPGCWPVVGPRRIESAVDSIRAREHEVDDALRAAFADDLASRGVPL
ncbi:MAG: aldo/keto reductase [Microcella pacifica]|uniref:aldo/keto reductase n=1 Tax=Microcella pacifica TaxID=2591847 RepID=UPI00331472C2